MPYDDVPVKNAPATWGAANRMLAKGSAKVTDADLFGDDPLAPSKKADPLKYLGHMASDSVADEGHNTPNIKRVGAGPHAKQGFRKIEGNYETPVCTPKMREKRDADYKKMCAAVGIKHTPMMSTADVGRDVAPLRKLARAAKSAAKAPQGPLRSKHR